MKKILKTQTIIKGKRTKRKKRKNDKGKRERKTKHGNNW